MWMRRTAHLWMQVNVEFTSLTERHRSADALSRGIKSPLSQKATLRSANQFSRNLEGLRSYSMGRLVVKFGIPSSKEMENVRSTVLKACQQLSAIQSRGIPNSAFTSSSPLGRSSSVTNSKATDKPVSGANKCQPTFCALTLFLTRWRCAWPLVTPSRSCVMREMQVTSPCRP